MMLKPIVMILLLLGCTFSALAETRISSEFTHLQSIRAKKITEIDTAYVKALEKLKLKVMKRGDLVTANAINAELIKINGQRLKEDNPTVKETTSVTSKADGGAPLPEEIETEKVTGGVIAYIEIGTKLRVNEAREVAEKYGGTLYCPYSKADARKLFKLLSKNGQHQTFLDVTYSLSGKEITMRRSDNSIVDLKKLGCEHASWQDLKTFKQSPDRSVFIGGDGVYSLGFWKGITGTIIIIPK